MTQEHLVEYLLNTLDPTTRRAVEAYLRTHPDAAARVEQLRQTLAPWDAGAEALAPPPDLVRRTLERVAGRRAGPLPAAPRRFTWEVGGSGRRFRRADLAVAAAVLLLVGGLVAAWLPGARARANELACQNQMRVVWHALEQYSEAPQNHGEFPRVEANGPRSVAGAFVPMLQDAGYLPPDVSLVCSATGEPAGPRPSLHELEQLYRDQPDTFKSVAGTLAGTYAYTLGYGDANGTLVGLGRESGDYLPLLADAPPPAATGLSLNHGGRGQNVLYIGGNVRWCTQRSVGVNGDDIYLNQDGKLRTGRNWGDTVLAPSGATPFGPAE
jgi:hypothetical protein